MRKQPQQSVRQFMDGCGCPLQPVPRQRRLQARQVMRAGTLSPGSFEHDSTLTLGVTP